MKRFWSVSLAVFLLSFCGLALEVALTRVFAVVLRYHFAFFAIALALCGLGLGGYTAHWLKLKGNARGGEWDTRLFGFIIGFPLTTLFVVWFLIFWLLPRNPNAFWITGAVTILPFFCLGGAMALIFDQFSDMGGRLYALDLAGAATAAVGIVVILNLFGGLNAVVSLVGIASVCASILVNKKKFVPFLLLTFVFCFTFIIINRSINFFDLPPIRKARAEITKPMLAELSTGKSHIVFTVWNAFARTDVVKDEGIEDTLHIYTDGEVPAIMVRLRNGHLKDGEMLMTTLMGIPYVIALGSKEKSHPEIESVLALGSGGGADVVCALLAKAKRVDAVDVNPAMKIITDRYRDFNGGIYQKRGVYFHIAEGRTFVRQVNRKYDLIVMALTQTATTGKAGLALVESFIHTKEACKDYWDALNKNGIVALITQEPLLAMRWWATCLETIQEQTGKPSNKSALHLTWWMLHPDLQRFSGYRHLVVMRKQPFTQNHKDLLNQVTRQWAVIPICVPFVHSDEPMASVMRNEFDLKDVIEDTLWRYGANIQPVTDDAPFFVDLSPKVPSMLWQFVAFAVSVVFVFSVLVWLRQRTTPQPIIGFWLPTGYVSLLGIGFMLVEIGMLQRSILLLGSPTHTVALFAGSLLLGGSAGSFISQRVLTERLADLAMNSCAIVSVISSIMSLSFGAFVNALNIFPIIWKSVFLFAVAFGMGIPMGIPFPSAVRMTKASWWVVDSAYLWGVNGVMSVVGSIGAVMTGKIFGYSKAITLGAVCYLLATALMWVQSKKLNASN